MGGSMAGGASTSSAIQLPSLDTPSSSMTNTRVDENGMIVESTVDGEWTYDPNEPRYCICNQVSYGDMVACDNDVVSSVGQRRVESCIDKYLFLPFSVPSSGSIIRAWA